MNRAIALKVDVDTFDGMRQGVPRLQALLERHDVKGSFFVPMGKDHTGRTVKRIFTRPGFISKASRTSALKTYGFKTLLYGLLLPGPEIARRNVHVLRALADAGHEVGIHGLDHVYWHDHIKRLDRPRTARVLEEAADTFRETVGLSPASFAAPGWMTNPYALGWLEAHGFVYASDARGRAPFLPRMGGTEFSLPHLPTTMPTVDEVLGLEAETEQELVAFFYGRLTESLNVFTIHAELEGKHWLGFLDAFVGRTLDKGYRFVRLIDVAAGLDPRALPVCDMVYGTVPGRAGEVTVQQTACK